MNNDIDKKVRNLLNCFDHLTNGEDTNDIINAIIIFLAILDIKYASDDLSLEYRANVLKDTFIDTRNQLYVNMINEKSDENTTNISRILENFTNEDTESIEKED